MEILIAAVVVAVGPRGRARGCRDGRSPRRVPGLAAGRATAAAPAPAAPPAGRRRRRSAPRTARAPSAAPTCCASRSACGRARRRSRAAWRSWASASGCWCRRPRQLDGITRAATCASSSAWPACRPRRRATSCSRRSRTRSATTAPSVVRQVEEETKRDADRRVRNILSVVMQRLAAGHAAETTVSVVQLPADDMKGRIIGREGRNIRALEHLTGVDFIIDDTPERGHPLRLRRRPPRDRPHDAREAAPGRPHPPGPDRGDLLPGQVRAREPTSPSAASRRASTPTSRALDPELVDACSAGSSTARPTARTCSRTPSSAPTWRR